MNKLIYAIGIAIAATFASNAKIDQHQNKHQSAPIEHLSDAPVVHSPDSLPAENKVVLP